MSGNSKGFTPPPEAPVFRPTAEEFKVRPIPDNALLPYPVERACERACVRGLSGRGEILVSVSCPYHDRQHISGCRGCICVRVETARIFWHEPLSSMLGVYVCSRTGVFLDGSATFAAIKGAVDSRIFQVHIIFGPSTNNIAVWVTHMHAERLLAVCFLSSVHVLSCADWFFEVVGLECDDV